MLQMKKQRFRKVEQILWNGFVHDKLLLLVSNFPSPQVFRFFQIILFGIHVICDLLRIVL